MSRSFETSLYKGAFYLRGREVKSQKTLLSTDLQEKIRVHRYSLFLLRERKEGSQK